MSNVNLSIGGREYTVACAKGEEDHVAALGQVIDGKFKQMGGGQSEVRSLLFAALLLADEVDELRRRTSEASTPAPAATDIAPDRLVAIAERLEKLADALEG